jgi:transglutaminase-like putative cysteine protease
MSPGRISQLSNDNSVAFRVKFNSAPPPSNQLYWRGPVMWHFDGYTWTAPDSERIVISNFKFTGLSTPYEYSVTLEPHNSYWLFALDIPSVIPANARISTEMQVLSLLPVQKIQRYNLTSYTHYILPRYSQFNMDRYLQVPASSAPRARQLIQRLQDKSTPENTVQNVLNYFATQDFYYTRNPPLLFDQPIDAFLFESKRGYCEHYASSFAILMRLAGIPSRVVTGYQGGEINPLDGFMTLRQSDAHAWVEVYLNKKGWVRVDPTAAIPPGNIENTADAIRLNSTQPKPSQLFETSWLTKSFKRARFTWDAINNRWNQWVLGYDTKRQKAFFEAIGIPEITWQGLSQLLFSILGILSGLLALLVFRKNRNPQDEVQKIYSRFLHKLKKYKLVKHHAEGSDDFAKRAMQLIPDKASIIKNISDLYQELRYGKHQNQAIEALKKQVEIFH